MRSFQDVEVVGRLEGINLAKGVKIQKSKLIVERMDNDVAGAWQFVNSR